LLRWPRSTFGKTNTISDQRYDALRRSKSGPLMSALGQKRTLRGVRSMSALPPKADIAERDRHVRFVPKADIGTAKKHHSIRLDWSSNSTQNFQRWFPQGIKRERGACAIERPKPRLPPQL
jgi:hypothetical protein